MSEKISKFGKNLPKMQHKGPGLHLNRQVKNGIKSGSVRKRFG